MTSSSSTAQQLNNPQTESTVCKLSTDWFFNHCGVVLLGTAASNHQGDILSDDWFFISRGANDLARGANE